MLVAMMILHFLIDDAIEERPPHPVDGDLVLGLTKMTVCGQVRDFKLKIFYAIIVVDHLILILNNLRIISPNFFPLS